MTAETPTGPAGGDGATTDAADEESTAGESADAAGSVGSAAAPPGPDGYPLLGSMPRIVRDPLGFFDEIASYGDVVRYRIAGKTSTALLHPEYVQRVLVEEPGRFERYLAAEMGIDFAPEGLLFTGGEQWRTQRQVVQPAFTMDRIRSYADAMSARAERTAATWSDGDEIALNRAFSRLTLEILSKALFDLEVDPGADDEPIVRGARVVNERAGPELNLTGLVPNWVPTPGNRRYRRAIDAYRERVDELIARRRDGADGDDLLSILLRARADGGALSEAEIRDDLITFTFAGHETTSLALTYTVLSLATHEDVRDRLDAELEAVLDGDRPAFEHVSDLEYTDRVIREAMRIYPPAPMLFREPTEDVVVGGYSVPAGSIVTLPQYRIHRDGRFYDDPDRFRPDRWAEGNDRPEYAYFPFGGGPRHCIGMRFATLELKLVVATLARRFEFDLLSDPDPDMAVGATLRPASDVRVRVRERDAGR